jgi:hypothetical protein
LQFLFVDVLCAETNKSVDVAVTNLGNVFERLRQQLDEREKFLIARVKTENENKQHRLDLSQEYLEVLKQTAEACVHQATNLLTSSPQSSEATISTVAGSPFDDEDTQTSKRARTDCIVKDEPGSPPHAWSPRSQQLASLPSSTSIPLAPISIWFAQDAWNCNRNSKSIVEQIELAKSIDLRSVLGGSTRVQLSNTAAFSKALHILSTVGDVVSRDALKRLRWGKCKSEGDGSIRLKWEDDNADVLAESVEGWAGGCAKLEYTVWRSEGRDTKSKKPRGPEVGPLEQRYLVYRGTATQCVVNRLQESMEYSFTVEVDYFSSRKEGEIGADYDDVTTSEAIKVKTMSLAGIPKFSHAKYGAELALMGLKVIHRSLDGQGLTVTSDVLDRRDVLWWKVRIHSNNKDDATIGLGIITDKVHETMIASEIPLYYGWASQGTCYIDGAAHLEGHQWAGWDKATEAVLKLSRTDHTFSVLLINTLRIFTLNGLQGTDWRFQVYLQNAQDAVEIIATDPTERF